MSAVIAFLIKNPIARKVALIGLALGGLWYINKLSINHAYDQGRIEGAQVAWVAAEKAQADIWREAQQKIQADYHAVAQQAEDIRRERAAFDQRAVENRVKRAEALKSTAEAIKVAQENFEAASVEPQDNLPPKEVILGYLSSYKEAYEVQVYNYANLEAEYEESLRLMNKSIAERNAQVKAVEADLEQTRAERDFYEQAFKQGAKKVKRGFWHKVKRVVTLGIAR